jgi:hypothetical protein
VPVILNHDADVQTNGVGALYLNPAAFALVPRTGNNIPRRLGTAPSRLPNVRGPAVFGEDFGLQKKFAFNESTGGASCALTSSTLSTDPAAATP